MPKLRKIYLIFLAGLLGISNYASAIAIDVADAPDNDLSLAVAAISGATESIKMNIYEFSSPEISQAVVAKIQQGLEVQILDEGNPVGGYSKASKAVRQEILDAMGAAGTHVGNHFYMMQKAPGVTRRFHYDHAKYTVIDGESLLIGSENYSPTGNANGGKANRGWEVFIHDRPLAEQFATMFTTDSDPTNPDITDFAKPNHLAFSSVNHLVAGALALTTAVTKPRDRDDANLTTLNADSVASFTSPETSLDGLTKFISESKKSLDLELMTFTSDWGSVGKVSPLLTAVQTAGKKHKNVRVLLNDNNVFAKDGADGAEHTTKNKNLETVTTFNKTKGNVVAAIADLKAMGVTYIHNKGGLADGDRVLISSINWDSNSVEHNRESAVVITGTEIYNFYSALYQQDWATSSHEQ